MRKLPLYLKIIFGLLLGIVWALLSSWMGWSEITMNWIAPWGRIFINLLKLVAVPLVLFSIISGVIGIGNPSNLGRLGLKTMGLYLFTTFIAVALGLILVNVFKPGKAFDGQVILENRIDYELWAIQEGIEIKDGKCFSCLEENKLMVQEVSKRNGYAARDFIDEKIKVVAAKKEAGPLLFIEDMVPSNIFSALQDSSGMLKVIFFAIFFGIALLFVPREKSKPVTDFINGTMEVFLRMVDLIMGLAPFFVFALMAGLVAKMAGDNPVKVIELFKGLSWYSLVVLGGLLPMAFIVYPLLLKIFVPSRRLSKFFRGIGPAQTLAFSTSSSAATLPVTIECVEESLKVDKGISGFVLPIGATINMDGTSLYQSVAVVFLAQMHGVDLTIGMQLVIVMSAVMASIGAAAIPSAGLVMLMVVLTSVGLNPAWIAIILPVDRILDMVRTVVNVTGDATVATIVGDTEKRNSQK